MSETKISKTNENVSFLMRRTVTVENIFGQLKKAKILKLIREFPLGSSLEITFEKDDRDVIYDARFLILSLYHLLSPEKPVNSLYLAEKYGLSLLIRATSSHDERMREIAFRSLSRLNLHILAQVKLRRNLQIWSFLIDYYRTVMTAENERIPSSVSLFMTIIVDTCINSSSHLFEQIMAFIRRSSRFETKYISGQIESFLFNDQVENWEYHQYLAMVYLSNAIDSDDDFAICFKHKLLFNVLNLYNSPFSNEMIKLLVLRVVKNCLKLEKSMSKVFNYYGIMTWLLLVTRRFNGLTRFKQKILPDLHLIYKQKNVLNEIIDIIKSRADDIEPNIVSHVEISHLVQLFNSSPEIFCKHVYDDSNEEKLYEKRFSEGKRKVIEEKTVVEETKAKLTKNGNEAKPEDEVEEEKKVKKEKKRKGKENKQKEEKKQKKEKKHAKMESEEQGEEEMEVE